MMNPQARLGAFILLALILLVFATGKIGNIGWIQQDNNLVEAEFDDLLGLDIQSPVRMAGVKIGIVQEIFLRNNRAVVRIALHPDVRLPASTRASIISRGLVGEKNLALTANASDKQALAEGSIIPSDPSGDINSFIAKASGISDDIRALTSGDGGSSTSIQQLISNINLAAVALTGLIQENRPQIKQTTTSMQHSMQALEHKLPAILKEIHQSSQNINQLISQHKGNLSQFAAELPKTAKAGTAFFKQGKLASESFNASIIDNRENFYRTLFELRTAAENLATFSDDIRRNPWKLMKEKPEVKASRRAKQAKMEELLMTTGKMGLAPAHQ